MPHLILVHGLWMPGISMTLLHRRIAAAGFDVETFDYLSVSTPPAQTVEALRRRMRSHTHGVHLVGHSIGGLLALLACRGGEDVPPGRIVGLASPLTGSAIARQLAERGRGWLMGHSGALLERGVADWAGTREVGVVAGRTHMGMGAIVGHLEGDSDGTVRLEETRMPWLTDHCVVPASHTGMLVSRAAAVQTIAFLREGRFQHD
jgi:pimeloyl-ACP methyl ester carboxylesterase